MTTSASSAAYIGCDPGIPPATMSSGDLRSLLDDVPDTLEIVLRRSPEWSPVLDAWRDAAEEAAGALAHWRAAPGDRAYAVYRAAQDREDAAQDALVRQTHTSRTSVS
jgi:hypothetical protein